MSNISSIGAAARPPANTSEKAPPNESAAPPSFSRGAPVKSAAGDGMAGGKHYVNEPYPAKPQLIGGTQVQGRILNGAYVRQALRYDLLRLQNDLAHGRLSEAAKRVELMPMVDIRSHLKDFGIEPELVAQLQKLTHDTGLTTLQMRSAMDHLLSVSGAAQFLDDSTVGKKAAT